MTVARAAGYDVVAGEPDEVEPHATDAAMVVASHGTDEETALARALDAGVGYVGLVASPRRGRAVLESLDVPDALRDQVHTPAGLDIGARTPAEVAVSILAQIVAERTAGHAAPRGRAPRGARRPRPPPAPPRRSPSRASARSPPRSTRSAGWRSSRATRPSTSTSTASATGSAARAAARRSRPTGWAMPESELVVAGLVLAAGGSSRLGQPKQLLPFGPATLLDHTLSTARRCRFSQLLVAIGGAADEVRARVDLSGTPGRRQRRLRRGLLVLDRRGDGRDRPPRATCSSCCSATSPGVTPDTVAELLAGRGDADLAVCRYDDGLGHPFCFSRDLFETLLGLHGDKAVWKLVAAGGDAVAKVHVEGPVPIDVDTWADYEAVR